MRRQRVQSYVSRELRARLLSYCAANRVGESGFVQALIEEHLDGKVEDTALVSRRLDRAVLALSRLERDIAALSEAIAVLANFCFVHAPHLSEAEQTVAKRRARARYDEFVETAELRLRSGQTLVRDIIPGDPLAEHATEVDAQARGDKKG